MSPIEVGILGMAVFCVFLAAGLPLVINMIVVSLGGLWYLLGLPAALVKAGAVPFDMLTSYDLAALPMFLLMANLLFVSGMGEKLYYTARAWLGHLPGGLSMATIGGCAAFGTVSASVIATTSTIGLVALPEMKKADYDDGLASASLAAGGTLGLLIPPSAMLIMYGIVTQTSIAKLFLAGYIPGILQAVFYIITIRIICAVHPEKGPRGPKFSLIDRFKSFGVSLEVWVLFGLVLVGLTVGWFTPTEGGAVGAFGALVIPLIRRRLTWAKIVEALKSTIKMTGMIYAMLIGAKLLTSFFAATNIPTELANLVGRMNVPPVAIMGFIILLYIVLGTAMDENAMLWTTVPILAPIVVSQGYDLIWFGIICCRMITIGGISPPLGLSAMVVSGMAKVPQGKVFKNLWPFLGSDCLHVLLLLLFPIVVMFLPNLAK